MMKKKSITGFTLVEIVITMIILSIILSIIYGIFIFVYKSNIRAEAENQAMNDIRITMMNMEREIREAKEIQVDKTNGEKIMISSGTKDTYYRVMNNKLEKSINDIDWITLIPLVQKISSQKYFEIGTNNKNVLIKMVIFDPKNKISSGIEIYNNFVPRSKGVIYSDF
jgi:prepilin-type N-terminal cleavage/methylation domain-containing protein